MITAKAIWTDNERYVGEATSRHAIVMDTAKEKTASTPIELVLIALCGCACFHLRPPLFRIVCL